MVRILGSVVLSVLLAAGGETASAAPPGEVKWVARLEPADLAPGQSGVLVVSARLGDLFVFADTELALTWAPLGGEGAQYETPMGPVTYAKKPAAVRVTPPEAMKANPRYAGSEGSEVLWFVVGDGRDLVTPEWTFSRRRASPFPGGDPTAGLRAIRRIGSRRESTPRAARPTVGILVFEGVELLDFAGPAEVSSSSRGRASSSAWSRSPRRGRRSARWGIEIVPTHDVRRRAAARRGRRTRGAHAQRHRGGTRVAARGLGVGADHDVGVHGGVPPRARRSPRRRWRRRRTTGASTASRGWRRRAAS